MNRRNFSSFSKRRKSNFKKIDYKNKDFKNPFFQNKKRSFSKPNLSAFLIVVKSRLTIIAISIIIIAGIYLLFFSTLCEIKQINISGLSRIDQEEVMGLVREQKNRKRFWILPQSNLLIFKKNELEQRLKNRYDFSSVKIEKDFPKTIDIKIQEKSPVLVWLEEGIYYSADADGHIISEISALDVKKDIYPVIENKTSQKIDGQQIVFDKEKIAYSTELFSIFVADVPDIKIEKFILDDDAKTLKLKIVNGPEVYFNIEEDAHMQINKLLITKNERLKNDFFNKTYIDLRYGDRIYYR